MSRRSPSRCILGALITWYRRVRLRDPARRRDPDHGGAQPVPAVRPAHAGCRIGGIRDAPWSSVGPRAIAFGADRPVRRLPHRVVRLAVTAHRVAASAVLVLLDRRPPADGRHHRLAVGRPPRGRRPRSSSRVGIVVLRASGHRRVATPSGWLRLPSCRPGSAGPFRRQLADRTGGRNRRGGSGSGLYATFIVASADAFANEPRLDARRSSTLIKTIYPAIDINQPSGILQLTFFGFGSFILGLAGASFLAGWASDEGRPAARHGAVDRPVPGPLGNPEWARRC